MSSYNLALARQTSGFDPYSREYFRQLGRHNDGRQLVKLRYGSKVPFEVDLGTHSGPFEQHLLRKHVPRLFHKMRATGDRVTRPLDYFSSTFSDQGDHDVYTLGLEWIFLTIANFRTPNNSPIPGDPVDRLVKALNLTLQSNTSAYSMYASLAVRLCSAIASIIRPDSGFHHSIQLFGEFRLVAASFIRYVLLVDERFVYTILEAVWDASAQDLAEVAVVLQNVPFANIANLRQWVLFRETNGDILARDMLQHGLV